MDTVSESRGIFLKNVEAYFADYYTLLRFPSISSLERHRADCTRCAQWLKKHLASIGFDSELIQTGGTPSVYGFKQVSSDLPTVLLYGHYDVQPPGDLSRWLSPPFEPAERSGRVYARGARDNKGQFFFALKALQSLIEIGWRGCNVKILLDGEEEIGSPGLLSEPDLHAGKFKHDILLAFETGGSPEGDPAITAGLRGIVSLKLKLSGPNRDLHSGNHGGRVRNPALELAKLLASLHNKDGSIAVAGFYDDVTPRSDLDKKMLSSLTFDEEHYRTQIGVDALGGEALFSPVERVVFRPTIEVNGISSGHCGEEFSTSIPSVALATLTARLVPGQEPQKCLELIACHLNKFVPSGVKLELLKGSLSAPAFSLNTSSHLSSLALNCLAPLCRNAPLFVWSGASVPLIAALRGANPGSETLLVGFGQDADNEHGPNESFSRTQFENGFTFTHQLFQAIRSDLLSVKPPA